MALVINDRVKVTSTTTGTGAFALGAAVTGFETFAAIYNTDTVDSTANRLVVVLDFGGNKTATNGTFTITFPDPTTPANAIISMA